MGFKLCPWLLPPLSGQPLGQIAYNPVPYRNELSSLEEEKRVKPNSQVRFKKQTNKTSIYLPVLSLSLFEERFLNLSRA